MPATPSAAAAPAIRTLLLCDLVASTQLVWRASGKWPDGADEVPYDFRRACEQVRDAPKDGFGF